MNHSTGQTLIETVVALFVLVTGLAAGLSLAAFSFGATSDISEKITATGLAREGLEAVRRMRDSNWLAGNLTDCGGGEFCYATWLNEPGKYNLSGTTGSGLEYHLFFNPASSTNKLTLSSANPSSNFRLYEQVGGGWSHTVTAAPTIFFRKINIIYTDTNSPYSATSPLVLVRSTVWWHGKSCPTVTYVASPSDTSCKIISEEYLTNWKNY